MNKLTLSLFLILSISGFKTNFEPQDHKSQSEIKTIHSSKLQLQESTCRERDSLALVALWNATHENGDWTNEWDLEMPMDTWFGVTLNDEGCVTCLDLDGNPNCTEIGSSGNNLSGIISNELGNLIKLERLILSSNKLKGKIPDELGNLNKLEMLWLAKNQLTGSIPIALSNLNNLVYLILNDNQLVGNIPPELGNLNNLRQISLGFNRLTGTIPAELKNLNNLQEINLRNNQLTGTIPSELGNLASIQFIIFSYNKLIGSIPTQLGNLNTLKELYLSGNQLTGNIPTELSNLLFLRTLWLDTNRLMGNIPSELGSLSNLESINLARNQLIGNLPTELSKLINLRSIFLNDNDLSGCFPLIFTSFCNISFDFSNNLNLRNNGNFQVFCENNMGSCEELDEQTILNILCEALGVVNGCEAFLNGESFGEKIVTKNADGFVEQINYCGINPSIYDPINCDFEIDFSHKPYIPKEIGNLKHLKKLLLNDLDLAGEIPESIGNLMELEELNLSNTKVYFSYENDDWSPKGLTGIIPESIGNLTKLKLINLSGNQLLGSIPNTINDLKELETLDLSWNQLDQILSSVNQLRNLQYLALANNNLNGVIPSGFDQLSDLEVLRLENNNLSGSMDSITGLSRKLWSLYLSNNKFSGDIPEQIGNLRGLEFLALDRNQLTGSVPSSMRNLRKLHTLLLNNNQLSGILPSELWNNGGEGIKILALSNNEQLEGGITNFTGHFLFLENTSLSFIENIEFIEVPVPTVGCTPTLGFQLDCFADCFYYSFFHERINEFGGGPLIGSTPLPYFIVLDRNNTPLPDNCRDMVLNLQDSKFSFADLEDIIQTGNLIFDYQNQDSIFKDTTIYLAKGANLDLDLGIDENMVNNQYEWQKDGLFFQLKTGDNNFNLTNVQETASGVYQVSIMNPDFPNLTLFSHAIRIVVNCAVSESIYREVICQNEFVEINNTIYNNTNRKGIETIESGNANGCDSVITVDLSFYEPYVGQWDTIICSGESLLVGSIIFNEAFPQGLILYEEKTINGCDSNILIQVDFYPSAETFMTLLLDDEDSIFVNGQVYNINRPSGKEILKGQAQNGCDSIINISLSFKSAIVFQLEEELCSDENIVVNGQIYDKNRFEGTEILEGQAQNGCDSIVSISLSFLPNSTFDLNEQICQEKNIVINNQIYGINRLTGTEILEGQAQNGCDSIVNINLSVEEIQITKKEITHLNCYNDTNGSIIITEVKGGIQPYLYSLNNNSFSDNTIFENLAAGEHLIRIEDASGCHYEEKVFLEQPDTINFSIDKPQTITFGTSITLAASSSLPENEVNSIQWLVADSTICSNCPNLMVTPSQNITYTAILTGLNDCQSIAHTTITVDKKMIPVYVPNIFSPNGDGINDYLTIGLSDVIKTVDSFKVFNRWGIQVHETHSINNTLDWDGNFNGKNLESGVYLYVLQVTTINGQSHTLTGDISLIR